jgi:hypothetical protein
MSRSTQLAIVFACAFLVALALIVILCADVDHHKRQIERLKDRLEESERRHRLAVWRKKAGGVA